MKPRSPIPGAGLLLAVLAALILPAAAAAQQAVQNPHGTLPAGLSCSDCHTAEGWRVLRKDMRFNHAARTGVALTGQHSRTPCAACHLDLRFDRPHLSMSDCGSCHVDVHQGRMPGLCVRCHDTRSFQDAARIDAHDRTSFPLTGMHARLPCDACHRNDRGGAFTPLPTDCYACHASDYRGTRLVDHVAAHFPKVCQQCHTTASWVGAEFDHATASGGFALTGAHAALACTSCHVPPDNHLIATPSGPNDCVACHQADYNKEHGGSGFPTTCTTCHTTASWSGATFDHSAVGFPLTGAHATLACTSCHVPPDNHLIATPSGPDDCVACHQADYNKQHGGSGFPTTCTMCHTTSSWSQSSFDHDQQYFPIYSGTHAGRWSACTDCHTSPSDFSVFSCLTCHLKTQTDQHHTGVSGYVYDSAHCLACHPSGRGGD